MHLQHCCRDILPTHYATDDEEIFGEMNPDKLHDILSKEITYASVSQQLEIERSVLFYLIAKQMWTFIKQTTHSKCEMCISPQRLTENNTHSCVYIHSVYFVTPPQRLLNIIDSLYQEALRHIDWIRILNECQELSLSDSTVRQCNETYWRRIRNRSQKFDLIVRINLLEIARQGGYFSVVLQIMKILGWD